MNVTVAAPLTPEDINPELAYRLLEAHILMMSTNPDLGNGELCLVQAMSIAAEALRGKLDREKEELEAMKNADK